MTCLIECLYPVGQLAEEEDPELSAMRQDDHRSHEVSEAGYEVSLHRKLTKHFVKFCRIIMGTSRWSTAAELMDIIRRIGKVPSPSQVR
jgi:hypothetical protein